MACYGPVTLCSGKRTQCDCTMCGLFWICNEGLCCVCLLSRNVANFKWYARMQARKATQPTSISWPYGRGTGVNSARSCIINISRSWIEKKTLLEEPFLKINFSLLFFPILIIYKRQWNWRKIWLFKDVTESIQNTKKKSIWGSKWNV